MRLLCDHASQTSARLWMATRHGSVLDWIIALFLAGLILLAGLASLDRVTVDTSLFGIPPGTLLHGVDLGLLGPESARHRVEMTVKSLLAQPIYLEWEGQLKPLRSGREVLVEIPAQEVVEEALGLARRSSLLTQLRRWAYWNYPETPLNWSPKIDTKHLETQIASFLGTLPKRRTEAAQEPHGRVRLEHLIYDYSPEWIARSIERLLVEHPRSRRLSVAAGRVLTRASEGPLPREEAFGHLLGLRRVRWGQGRASSEARIERILAALDGTILSPEEVWSALARLPARLLTPAGSLHETEESETACAVLSALFGAAARSGLNILERSHHRVLTDAVGRHSSPGMDVSVTRGHRDFQFENQLRTPLLIRALRKGDLVEASLWSTEPAPYEVEVVIHRGAPIHHETVVLKRRAAADADDAEKPVEQKGYDGHRVEVTRTVRVLREGFPEPEPLPSKSRRYKPRRAIVVMGRHGRETTAVPLDPSLRTALWSPSTP